MTASTTAQHDLACCAIRHTATVEDYLKSVFALTAPGSSASTSAIAEHLGVTPASASTMVSRLREGGLLEQAGWGAVVLTPHGLRHASAVVRRHRLLETLLHELLGLGWDEVHAEAEVLEHGLSERVEDLIDAALGHPDRDPHGDPIPSRSGPHREVADTPLVQARPGERFVVRRVFDRDSEALRELAHLGIRPGSTLDIEDRAAGGGLRVRTRGTACALEARLVGLIQGDVVDRRPS